MADSQAVNEGSNADRLAVIRQRATLLNDDLAKLGLHTPTEGRALSTARDALWLLDALAEAEAKAEQAERELDELRGKLPGIVERSTLHQHCGRSKAHPAHGYMFAHRRYQCPGLDADV